MRRNSMEEPPEKSEVNIMLLGSTGSGKSASGNTIIGVRETFKEDVSPSSVTRTCESAQTEMDGQTITVIDTVGLSDTSVKITDAQTEIEEILQSTCDGIDVFLLVIKLGETFTESDSKVVKWIQDNFGAKFSNHTIVLFTHGDQLHGENEVTWRYVSECETLRSVVDQCSGRYHVFNNKDEDTSQVAELLEKIELLREKNGYSRYTEQDYKETQNDLLLKKCATGAAVGALGGAAAGAAAGAAIVGALGGAASGGAVGAKAVAGEGVVAALVGGSGGGVIASVMGTAFTAGQAALIGAAGGAALAAGAVYAGVYFLKRRYISKEKDKRN